MSFVLDDRFAWFLKQFGQPTESKPVTEEILDKFRSKLPSRLLEYWQEYGFCSFKDGLFWMVNPDDYKEAMQAWLESTDIPDEDSYYVIARSAFGDLFLWGEKTGSKYVIEPRDGCVFEEGGDENEIINGKGNEALSGFFVIQSPERIDLEDVKTDKGLFEQCVNKYGVLSEDEMFGFEPALFSGGTQEFKNLNKINIHIHLTILLQLVGKPEVIDIDGLAKKAFN